MEALTPTPITAVRLAGLEVAQPGELRDLGEGSWDLTMSMTGEQRAELPKTISRAKYVGVEIGRTDGGVSQGKAYEIDYAAVDHATPAVVTIHGWELRSQELQSQ